MDTSQHQLAGRVILVTGAGDGIGRAAAMAFAEQGAQVVLLGRTISKLETVYDQIVAAKYTEPAIYPLNLLGAVESDYEQLANTVETELGRLDGILHNASLLGKRTPLEQYDSQLWEDVLKVNVTAEFMLTKACLPLLSQSQDASILFTSSSVGRQSKAYWGAYAVSKFATEGLMQTLAAELSNTTNIRVNSINPGATRTSMRAEAYPAENPQDVKAPEDLMPLYIYLMSEASKAHKGQAIDATSFVIPQPE